MVGGLTRRSFMGAILAGCAAPAIVRAGILMPCRGIIIPNDRDVMMVFYDRYEQVVRGVAMEASFMLRNYLIESGHAEWLIENN